jgi:hypothetical protein
MIIVRFAPRPDHAVVEILRDAQMAALQDKAAFASGRLDVRFPVHPANFFKHSIDPICAQFVENPIFDLLAFDHAGLLQDLHVISHGWLLQADFLGDVADADAVIDQITINLRREVGFGIGEPMHDAQPVLVGQGAQPLGG